MWNWFSCYLSGGHHYGMCCEPGAIFLRCIHCGRRSGDGWALAGKPEATVKPTLQSPPPNAHVLPFDRQAAAR